MTRLFSLWALKLLIESRIASPMAVPWTGTEPGVMLERNILAET